MGKSAPVNELTLRDVKSQFGLSQTENPDFFSEWQRTTSNLDEEDLFSVLNPGNDLYQVAGVLQHLGMIVRQPIAAA